MGNVQFLLKLVYEFDDYEIMGLLTWNFRAIVTLKVSKYLTASDAEKD